MSRKLSEKEIQAVLNSDVDARVRYFVHKVAAMECFWLMCDEDDDLLIVYDAKERECIPVWPFKEYADVFFEDCVERKFLKEVQIQKFLDERIDKLIKRNVAIFVFPDTKSHGAFVMADVFRNMMEDELAKYGDYGWKDF
ncbi:MAG: DUF2750 domain-containing protein [Holosporaceae bacterium]|jgi:hypothetical protein|nr:DUF2750 domain-containing protein [Holosporaceae bacterium]